MVASLRTTHALLCSIYSNNIISIASALTEMPSFIDKIYPCPVKTPIPALPLLRLPPLLRLLLPFLALSNRQLTLPWTLFIRILALVAGNSFSLKHAKRD